MIPTVYGVIKGVTPETPCPASQIRLTVFADLDGPVTLEGQRIYSAVPDDGYFIDPTRLVNTWIHGPRHPDNKIRWIVSVWPIGFDCPDGGA